MSGRKRTFLTSPANTALVHSILGKKANRSSSLSQVVNYFDSSPSLSEYSASLLDSPLHRDATTPKQHSSFYNPREASDSDSDSDDDEYLRDISPEISETDNRGLRSRQRSLKGYPGPKRWPSDRIKGSTSSSSSGQGTASNSTTSLTGQADSMSARQGSPDDNNPSSTVRGSMSDIGSEDLPMQRLNVSRNDSTDMRLLSSPFVRRLHAKRLILKPKSLQRIAATLAEESAPTEAEMKREGMLYRYLRDYTPSSPMASPVDINPYDVDVDEDATIDAQLSWWGEPLVPTTPVVRREPSPSVDPMDISTTPQPPPVQPITIPEPRSRRQSLIISEVHISPTNTTTQNVMPPPMIPQVARMKRKGMSHIKRCRLNVATAEYGIDAVKRRAISPGSSPLLSPISVGPVRERRGLTFQDTHNGLEKMSLQD